MLKSSAPPAIRLRGVRHNNLKNFDLNLPLNQLVVITGLSGSGKSSLAFDTLFAEGQRRYIETFSPYARQFFDRMDKPQVDSIEGIPPAIAIEQRNSVRTTRSTVGTMTEICDYMKMLWPHVAQLHCRQCGKPVRKDSPQSIWKALIAPVSDASPAEMPGEALVSFDVPLSEKVSLEESLALISKQGYQRLLIKGEVIRVEELTGKTQGKLDSITVVQDRVKLASSSRARFTEACEQAYHFGKGKLTIHFLERKPGAARPAQEQSRRFSDRLHCAECDIEYREPSSALFSFNHPVGACPKCRGFGRVISIDYDLAIPDRSKTLAQGLVKPWQSGMSAECQTDLMRMCRHFEIPTDIPFNKLPKKWQDFVIDGEPGYGKDEEHEWPRAWYGIKGYFRWLESKAYKMHVRVLLSRYRAYTPCPDCQGQRFQPEALLYKVQSSKFKVQSDESEAHGASQRSETLTLAEFYQLPIRDALSFIETLTSKHQLRPNDPLGLVLGEVRARLGYLHDVGLGYLTLDRPTRSLSGGETERVSLTTCLGTRLVNTLFVLDEPSVGLHPRDTERLVRILEQLRNAGNTVVVVEHEASVMRAADQLIDLGPGHGASGGNLVFQGTFSQILKSQASLTGQYLSGRKSVEIPCRRPVAPQRRVERSTNGRATLSAANENGHSSRDSTLQRESFASVETLTLNEAPAPDRAVGETCQFLTLSNATKHNLQDLTVDIPLGRFVCVTGVSGSGKTTLVREVLLPTLASNLNTHLPGAKASDRIESEQNADNENEETTGSSARLDPPPSDLLSSVILVDQSILGKTPRSNPAVYIGAFDDIREVFAQSELAKQRGFNASAFSFNSAQGQCERCRGAGFEKIEMQFLSDVFIRCPECNGRRYRPHILEVKIGPKSKAQSPKSIADLLESTVEEAIEFLSGFCDSRPAERAVASLKLLSEVGLGYLKLGQPINTLSGGESQRLKLVRHLAEAEAAIASSRNTQHATRDVTAKRGINTPRLSAAVPTALPTLFLFDEPTTGLHFDDVRVLLKVFQRLVDSGHSVLVIEHNLDVVKSADWIIDLGPDAGDQGGQIVAQGTPEQVAKVERSHTGQALKGALH